MSVHNARQILIKEKVETSVMPSNHAELDNEVILKPGFHIRGGIFSSDLHAEGCGIVEGPVLIKKEAVLEPPAEFNADGKMIFACGLNAGDLIQVRFPVTPESSPIFRHTYQPLIIRGDICTNSLKLENALILGNIHCDDAVVENSIIFGTVIARNQLVIRNTTAISCRASRLVFQGADTLISPVATAYQEIKFDHNPAPIIDKSINANETQTRVRYLGLCSGKDGSKCPDGVGNIFTCRRFFENNCGSSHQFLTTKDIYQAQSKTDEKKRRKILTILPRLTDTKPVEEELEDLKELIETLNMLPHMNDKSRIKIEKEFADRLEWSHFIKTFSACTPIPGGEISPEDGRLTGRVKKNLSSQGQHAGNKSKRIKQPGARIPLESKKKKLTSRIEINAPKKIPNEMKNGLKVEKVLNIDNVASIQTVLISDSIKNKLYAGRLITAFQGFGPEEAENLFEHLKEITSNYTAVLKYTNMHMSNGDFLLLRNFLNFRSLGQIMEEGHFFSWSFIKKIAAAVAAFIEKSEHSHGALHSGNIFVDNEGLVYFSDHGMNYVRSIVYNQKKLKFKKRHEAYPDLSEYGSKISDIKCLGLMMVELLEGTLDNIKNGLDRGLSCYGERTGMKLGSSIVRLIADAVYANVESPAQLRERIMQLPD